MVRDALAASEKVMRRCTGLSRRALLKGSVLLLAGCHRTASPDEGGQGRATPADDAAALPEGWHDLSFEPAPDYPRGERAFVRVPPGDALPLLVAFHGRTESLRSLDVGAGAWMRDYNMQRQYSRLESPPLVDGDFRGMGTPARIEALNASLQREPFRGIVTACPYCPDLVDRSVGGAAAFGRFVAKELVPRARTLGGCKPDRLATGIDGISMGGRLALIVGLSNPDVFGVVGAMQPALRVEEAETIANLARSAMAKGPLSLRILSSDEDEFRGAAEATADRLAAAGVPHEFLVLRGKHGYEFNRGPGCIEMLAWHERVERGLPAP
jgi:iron(III)-salmochelin esterase